MESFASSVCPVIFPVQLSVDLRAHLKLFFAELHNSGITQPYSPAMPFLLCDGLQSYTTIPDTCLRTRRSHLGFVQVEKKMGRL